MPTCQPLALRTCTTSPCCWSLSAPKDQSSPGRRRREGWRLLWPTERGHLGTLLAPRALGAWAWASRACEGSGGLPAAVPEGVLTFYPGPGDGVQSRSAPCLESVFICIYCGQPPAPVGPSIRDWTSWIHPPLTKPHSSPGPRSWGVGIGLPSRCCPIPGAQSGAGDRGVVTCPRCCLCCSGYFSKGQR